MIKTVKSSKNRKGQQFLHHQCVPEVNTWLNFRH